MNKLRASSLGTDPLNQPHIRYSFKINRIKPRCTFKSYIRILRDMLIIEANYYKWKSLTINKNNYNEN